jgi:hypothetical protein
MRARFSMRWKLPVPTDTPAFVDAPQPEEPLGGRGRGLQKPISAASLKRKRRRQAAPLNLP